MKNLLDDWISRAEEDYRIAIRLLKSDENDFFNGICFHSQQCVEKYLKAFLVQREIKFDKKHDLIYLINLIRPVDSTIEFIRIELEHLNSYAVDIRYPGDTALKDEAEDAVKATKTVRTVIREKLGLSKRKSLKKKKL